MPIHLCRFMAWIDVFALTTSIYSLTIISIDRYLKISKPLQYKYRMTTSIMLKTISVMVLISISFATYSATPHSGTYGISDSTSVMYRVHTLNMISRTLPLVNSLCNPIIYAWLDKSYREAFKHVLYCIICRRLKNRPAMHQ
ncbi:type-1 angiotensin II receptor-like [Dendronephthya gigantea]|uniref:type-1 angiotensin II receptor-like n=1 Tax=Dendronephthya gigantea TaxID=151771 RepID=UPI00106A3CFE|nr:type-1 angiotensin II receptor-like [Dendronephthya gigantea]